MSSCLIVRQHEDPLADLARSRERSSKAKERYQQARGAQEGDQVTLCPPPNTKPFI